MAFEQMAYKLRNVAGDLFTRKKAQLLKSGSRFVLFIGDEGAILVHIKDNAVKSRQFIPDTSPQNLESLRETMAADTKAALMVVVDTIDQSYIQQTLPPVSALSIKKLIRRRLERDFGADDIKGAVILGREMSGRKDWNFMMISLERTPLLNTWIEFIDSLNNRFQGFYLVAAESELLLRSLERALPKSMSSAEWKFFVSHNKVSGFRQVILHKGRVVFTRMSQPVGEMTPEVLAGNIEQEMLSTIEYMRRLSFDPQSGLDVFIIASSAIRSVLDTAKFGVTVKQLHVLTPYEVAQHLGIDGATQPADQFGDVVLAANIGRSARHVLTLHTVASQKFSQLYQLMIGQRLAALGFAGLAGLYVLGIMLMMYSTYLDASQQQQIKEEQQKKLNLVRLAIRQSATDVEKTNDMIDLYAQLEKERFTPVWLLSRVQRSMVPSIVVKGIDVAIEEKQDTQAAPVPYEQPSPAAQDGMQAAPPSIVTAQLTLEFPGVTTLESFRPISTQLLDALARAFPGFDIAYTRLPNAFSESEKLDMTFGDNKAANANLLATQSFDVVLSISGMADTLESLPELQEQAPAEAETETETETQETGETQP